MGRGGALRRRARRRSVRPAISGIAPQGNAPSKYARYGARRGRADARKVCACGRARGLGYEGDGGDGGYVVSAARRQGRSRRCATRATAVSTVPRLYAGMRRACGHARRADLSSRAGGCARCGALGLPAHVPPRTAYLASCWVPGATWATRERAAARRIVRGRLAPPSS